MNNNGTKLFIFIIVVFFFSCEKRETPYKETLQLLYSTYKDGEIDECKLNNEVVFCAAFNGYDAAGHIYDNSGNIIGECDYAWGPIDSICHQMTNCEVIYRCKNHISGEPPVNIYNLGDGK
jgi:hypothetical protein